MEIMTEHEVMKTGPEITNFANLYKATGLMLNQNERRSKLLNAVKERRNEALDQLRGIDVLFQDEQPQEEPMDVVEPYRKRKRQRFGKKIMLSEWFVDISEDLEENWYIKLCPVGVRNILVAHKGITSIFNLRNELKGMFKSELPGGGTNSNHHTFTLLDCIYHRKTRTYYILDVLVWNSLLLMKCSAEFRFFFLRSKIFETPNLNCARNKFKLINVEYMPAQLALLEEKLSHPFEINDVQLPLDGVLFYHKNAHYSAGITPLVGWLKPYMIPEKLGIPIHEIFMVNRPKNYSSMHQYLEQKKSKCRKKKGNQSNEMDAEDIEEPDDTHCMEN